MFSRKRRVFIIAIDLIMSKLSNLNKESSEYLLFVFRS
jgi:hypothetical protein